MIPPKPWRVHVDTRNNVSIADANGNHVLNVRQPGGYEAAHVLAGVIVAACNAQPVPVFYLFKSWANWDSIKRETLDSGPDRAKLERNAATLNAGRGIYPGCFYGVTDSKPVAYESLGDNSRRDGRGN